ncbi:MAG: N-acetylmuramoyl-L-alanine amidase [Actinomycetota bacterium]|nr:N-acetylmuramoyl-L-alanine amidase [Actinomycetota bacterium]
MKRLLAASLLALLAPAVAQAGDVRVAAADLSVGAGSASAGTRAPIRFNLVGLHWQGPGRVLFRTRSVGGRWSSWRRAAPEIDDLPDRGARERGREHGWHVGNPYWTGLSDRIAYRLLGRVRRVRAYFIRSEAPLLPVRTLSVAGSPPIIPRLSWGANERMRRGRPQYAKSVRFAVVHHTAGSNSYTRSESAAIIRGIEAYHVKANGWNDIGYNFLVDKYGQVFEGRFGGMTRNVVGAHAQGFNIGSVGVSLLGSYDSRGPSPTALTALARLLAWRLDIAHVDPLSTFSWISTGNPRFPSGTPVFLRTIAGHRDTGFTDCPGNALYARIPSLARAVAATGVPKLYFPRARGSLGGDVRFSGRLSAALPWSVTVRDASGRTVARAGRTSRTIAWRWDSSGARGTGYAWTIAARGVRPATGRIGGRGQNPPAALLSEVSASPAIVTPSDDGPGDYTTVRYRLAFDALVTVTFADASGTIATLFSEPRVAGPHSFRFTVAGLPDGRYRVVIRAETADGRIATATAPVLVSRLLRRFAAAPAVFSPNRDGRLDRITFSFELARTASVRLTVRQPGRVVAVPLERELEAGEHRLTWDGSRPGGRIQDGRYLAALRVSGETATVSLETAFVSDTRPPTVSLVSRRPLRVRVSETATLTIRLRGRRTRLRVRAGVARLPGAARRGRLVAQDDAGNRSKPLRFP